jgi:hypothetical protein
MMILRSVTTALCVLGPLTCFAHGANINGDATFISFSVPGAIQGTFPLSINASMTVTGYFSPLSRSPNAFVRAADGTTTVFSFPGASSTIPEGINAAGDITGFYKITPYDMHCFLRYADGRIMNCDPPAAQGSYLEVSAVSINDFGDIAGNYVASDQTYLFTRTAEGVYKTQTSFAPFTVPAAINASGSVAGFATDDNGSYIGFVVHPDGYSATFSVPLLPRADPGCAAETIPQGINAAGVIAGWYYNRCNQVSQGFVRSPEGVLTTWESPGGIFAESPVVFDLFGSHWISINAAGDITGSYIDQLLLQHGFVRNPYGTVTGFDPPEGGATNPTGINDGGAVTGFYQYKTGGPAVGFIRVP